MNVNHTIKFKTNRFVMGLIFLEAPVVLALLVGVFSREWLFSSVVSLSVILCFGEILYRNSTEVKFDSQGIEAQYIFGKYRIDWVEVEKIQEAGHHMVFEGTDKQFTIPSTRHWVTDSSYTAKEIFYMIERQAKQRIEGKILLIPKWHNTRIRQ